MTTIRVAITAECIAANPSSDPKVKEPIAHAIADAVGLPIAEVTVDGDGENQAIATMGRGASTLVQELPVEAGRWYWSYWDHQPVEPLEFDLVIEDWLVVLVAPTAERLAELLDDHLPRMAFRQYGQTYNDDPDFDVESYYRRIAEAMHAELVRLTPSVNDVAPR